VLHDACETIDSRIIGAASVRELKIEDLNAISFEYFAVINTFVESDDGFDVDLKEHLKQLRWSLRWVLIANGGTW
jgi:hypothetical protein